MLVLVRLTGLLAAAAGFREQEMEITEGATVGELLQALALPVSGTWTRAKVNDRLQDQQHRLRDGDEVFFFTIGGGG